MLQQCYRSSPPSFRHAAVGSQRRLASRGSHSRHVWNMGANKATCQRDSMVVLAHNPASTQPTSLPATRRYTFPLSLPPTLTKQHGLQLLDERRRDGRHTSAPAWAARQRWCSHGPAFNNAHCAHSQHCGLDSRLSCGRVGARVVAQL